MILTFLAFTLLFCLPPYFFILSAASTRAIPDLAVAGVMWAPGLAALITRLSYQRSLRGFGWAPGRPRYLLISYLLPVVGCVMVYGSVWATQLGGFSTERLTPWWRSLAIALTGGFLIEAALALGEELGWRGLLVPELAKVVSFRQVGLLSGSTWVLFHVPAIIFAGYHSRAPIWFGLPVFAFSFVAVSFVLAWLRLKSGSVWTAVLFHASHNLFVQDVFDGLTKSGSATQYVTTEFGLGLALVYSAAAITCWRRRKELDAVT